MFSNTIIEHCGFVHGFRKHKSILLLSFHNVIYNIFIIIILFFFIFFLFFFINCRSLMYV